MGTRHFTVKRDLQELHFLFHICPVQISCTVLGPDWNPTLSGIQASVCQSRQKGGKSAAFLADSESSLGELEMKVNFVTELVVLSRAGTY